MLDAATGQLFWGRVACVRRSGAMAESNVRGRTSDTSALHSFVSILRFSIFLYVFLLCPVAEDRKCSCVGLNSLVQFYSENNVC